MSRRVVISSLVVILVAVAAAWWLSSRRGEQSSTTPPSAGDPLERAAQARRLLDTGLARFEIASKPEEWDSARASFEALRELEPGEPAAVLGLAAVAFRQGQADLARSHIQSLLDHADGQVAALAEFDRGKLAYQSGDTQEVIAAYSRGLQLDPRVAYAYSLAEAYDAAGKPEAMVAALREARAHGSEPNAMIDVGLALEAVRSTDADERALGVEIFDATIDRCLAPHRYREPGDAARPDRELHDKIREYMESARAEVLAGGGSVPRDLRKVGNLLKGTTLFQSDSKAVREEMEVRPLDRLVSPALAALPPARASQAGLEAWQGFPALPGPLAALAIVDDAVDRESTEPPRRGAGLLALAGGSLYWLAPASDSWTPTGVEQPAGARRIVTGDLDGDGLMEAVVLGEAGLAVLDRDGEGAWAATPDPGHLASAGPFEQAILCDLDHDGFLDLLALAAAGDDPHNLVQFRNAAAEGLAPARPLPMQGRGNWEQLVAADLDLDGDQDLLLAGGGELTMVTNHRRELFQPSRVEELPPLVTGLDAADLDGDGFPEAVVVADRQLFVFTGSSAGVSADPLPMSDPATEGMRLHCLAIADLDHDGRLDVIVGGEPSAEGQPSLVVLGAGGVGEGTHRTVSGLLALSLTGDQVPGLLMWNPSGEILAQRAVVAPEQHWIGLRLRAPLQIVAGSKVPLDARGVRVECFSPAGRRVLQPRRPNLVLGVGGHRPHLIRVIWPNGMSEFLFDPAIDTTHEVMLVIRLEGSCPYLYAWNGERYEFVTDVLGISPLGMQVAPHVYNSLHPEEYLRLPDWVREREGRIELSLTEELREVTFVDQLELVAVDAPAGILAANGERFVMPPVEGLDLQLFDGLTQVAAATADDGADARDLLAAEDHRYLTNYSGRTRYQGLVDEHTLTLDLGETARSAEGRVALLLVGWLQWGNTSTNVAIGHDPSVDFIWPRLERPDGEGGWRPTNVQLGLPAGKPKWVALDLTGEIDPTDPRVRIVTNLEVYWDRIAVATIADPSGAPHTVQSLAPTSAEYSYGGYSRWYRPAPNGPDLFDYSDRRPYPWRDRADGSELRLAFDELEGFYVDYGDVVELITARDDLSLTVGAGDEVRVSFDPSSLQPPPSGWRRTWFLHSEGWDKDGDFNTAHGQTVEPLPFHARKAYPSDEPFPDTEAHRHFQEKTLSRWVSRDRLIRLAATAPPRDGVQSKR